MIEILSIALKWTFVALALSPMIAGIGWAIFEGSIRPRLIPHAEIEGLADDLMHRYPADPEEAAFVEEHTAWCRSKSYDQGKWNRVRKMIRGRLRTSPRPNDA